MARSAATDLTVGLDIGATLVKAVAAAPSGVVAGAQAPVTGTLRAAILAVLETLRPSLGPELRVGVTGQGRSLLAALPACASENEVLCLVRALARESQPLGSVIEIGGQTARWIQLGRSAQGAPRLADFALNDQCAAGVGAFLVQQASRLRMSVEELGRAAAEATAGASIAGRCAVFAKSDMIHLQQRGTSVAEIAYGLCLALARNFQATVLKGKRPALPVALAGGGALNPGLIRAFREVLDLDERALVVLPHPLFAGALGASRLAAEAATAVALEALLEALRGPGEAPVLETVRLDAPALRAVTPAAVPTLPGQAAESSFEAYLGIDVGSVSTDLVLLSPDGAVQDGIYLPTRGRPVEVLREALLTFHARHSERLRILGAGTTGSGRHLAARLVGADLAKNEISAQLRGALHYVPDADTIFEIGGQDSKFIRVEDGRLADFTMNKVCAAGTGSFLEEQCELLGLDVERDFANLAARSSRRVDLGARCTVFMETELQHAARKGAGLAELAAGLAESIARNYLQKVVGSHLIGSRIVFQGGVASNAAVVAAFERVLEGTITVHPHNRLSGAIGAALLARDALAGRQTTFKGLTAIGEHSSRSFVCQQCESHCEVTRLTVGCDAMHFGDTCERYTVRDSGQPEDRPKVPDLFAEREALLAETVAAQQPAGTPRGVIGLPRASLLLEHLPFWGAFFSRLGFAVAVSPPSSMQVLEEGARHLSAETCLPIKMAYGHAAALRRAGVERIFFPSIFAMEDPERPAAHGCPYCQAAPFMVRASLRDGLLTPEVPFTRDLAAFSQGMEPVIRALDLAPEELAEAFAVAWGTHDEFRGRLIARGRELLRGDFARGLVVVGRPYNLFDPFLNLNLSRHLVRLGVVAFPQSFLPENAVALPGGAASMPWRFPREALRTALWCREDPRLHPVLVTNFGCGPDAFLVRHLTQALPERDLLVLEFDEHRGEAGMLTRLEAFLDRIEQDGEGRCLPTPVSSPPGRSATQRLRDGKIYLPYFADHVYAFEGALRFVGVDAEALPLPDDSVRVAGEETGSGKECHAYAMLLGDLVGVARRHSTGPPVQFLYPGTTMPCLLAQFSTGFELDLERQNLGNVSIISPWSRGMITLFGMRGATQLWRGIVTADLLVRWVCQTRPYERARGESDSVHRENLLDLSGSLARDDLHGFCRRAEQRMRSVAADRSTPRPLVGVAGDVYTRINGAANLGLWHRLEALGCEVWPGPMLIDNLDFGLPDEVVRALRSGRYRDALVAGLLTIRKDWTAWPLRRRFGRLLERPNEPDHRRVLELASKYVGPRSQQLFLLNIAKVVDFARGGADGIVHAICLNCMLGTASAAFLDRIREDHDGIPIAHLVYAGTESAALETRLETFVHQVKAHHLARSGRPTRERIV